MEGPVLRNSKARAVFLDRDGTIVEDVHYLTRPEQLRLLPRAVEGLALLRKTGFRLVVVTNQGAIARGWLTEEGLCEIHERLNRMLESEGAFIDAFYYCPHLPDADVPQYARDCDCRKPRPGLFKRAAKEMNLDLEACYAVGDSERDVEAGRRAGCYCILIGSAQSRWADAHAADLAEAARLIAARHAPGAERTTGA